MYGRTDGGTNYHVANLRSAEIFELKRGKREKEKNSLVCGNWLEKTFYSFLCSFCLKDHQKLFKKWLKFFMGVDCPLETRLVWSPKFILSFLLLIATCHFILFPFYRNIKNSQILFSFYVNPNDFIYMYRFEIGSFDVYLYGRASTVCKFKFCLKYFKNK